MKATVTHVDRDVTNNIVFLEDISKHTGSMSVTNDAEGVVSWFRSIYGNRVRIVYKDTDNEWWEIVWSIDHSGTQVTFKQWHGLEWDILSRKE
jgi:predicted double-glycine peptidase